MRPKKPISSRPPVTAASRRRDAMKRLKEKWDGEGDFDSKGEPVVTPLLKTAEGGIPRIMEALRSHDNQDARDFVELYDSISAQDLKFLKLEDIAYAAGIGSLRLAEVATSATILHGQMTSKLILAAALPGIVRTSVRLAKTAKGGFDREMMLKAGGVLPIPKGAQIAIQTNVTTKEAETTTQDSEPQYLDAGERLRLISEAVDPKRLPSPPAEPIELGGRLDHMQSDVAGVLADVQ